MLEEETAQLREAAGFYERARQMSENPVEALRALDRLYERLRDWEAQSQVLAARVAAESTVEDGAPVDALYRLGGARSAQPGQGEPGGPSCSPTRSTARQTTIAPRGSCGPPRRSTATSTRCSTCTSTSGRQPGRERALIDALSRRGEVSGTDLGPWREATEVALSLGDTPRAEQLLQKLLTRAEQIDETDIVGEHTETNAQMRAWAHDTRAQPRHRRR